MPGVAVLEGLAEQRRDAEDVEEVAGDLAGVGDAGLAVGQQDALAEPVVVGGDVRDAPALLAPVEIVRGSDLGPHPAALGVRLEEGDEAVGVFEGEWAQDDGVEDGQDGHPDADSEHQGQHRSEDGRRLAPQSEQRGAGQTAESGQPRRADGGRWSLRVGGSPRDDGGASHAQELAEREAQGRGATALLTGGAHALQDDLDDLLSVALAARRRVEAEQRRQQRPEQPHRDDRGSSSRSRPSRPTSLRSATAPSSVARRFASARATERPRAVRA